ncbi:MAG: TetR/AcrR family transcriptional regulator [Candidatus Obscuribacter sp.]|jgi:AcrR family transcriptional regulator|nr:TetR/AcrR family transcriptional regulator [Candidatus Obscuribacter sp.]MBL0187961.1 TetR/AcrR family transcriptional regulator [Candidatus Obscuribacter sp.]MBP6350636.1 TetR/AcrR family transcriptional regulator [Candidatus Obscuribacter sp.]MBP6594393.1 TetR/AcrR family transcriptional regulator [Candidatus Obscuribacter sp.]MBP7577595.1 TetR/AcrR family transcriptional regulator [Candidatus Obscuribacter sp.]
MEDLALECALSAVVNQIDETKPRQPGRPKDLALTTRRREDILEVSTRLFAQRGFRNTDLKAVAEELGVAKGTIYNYFDTKNDLFLSCLAYGLEKLSQCVRERSFDIADPVERVSCAVQCYFEFFDGHPEIVELMVQERAEFRQRPTSTYFLRCDESCNPWVDFFENCRKEGVFRDMPGEKMQEFLGNQLYGTLLAGYFSGQKRPLKDQVPQILAIFFNGVLNTEAAPGAEEAQ